ncbi:SusD/RagB family nutrient-binding outer membrane lipoprotein [Chitinophagaceae bacterium 26-R-25]|nr:SusD/RagB family nutrient-binding outer membrane lipoprotein [Chitinophagaceae bacterium 26-R-25]
MKINKLNIIAAFLSIASITSCKKTLDVNNDPNAFSDGLITPASLLPSIEVNLAYALGGDATRITASLTQHYAGHRSQPLDYAQYNINPSSTDTYWQNMYTVVLTNTNKMIAKARQAGDSTYVGVGQIIEAYAFSVLTDMYGDIPFSDALQFAGDMTPAYDKQKDIYNGLFKMLDNGIANVKISAATSITGDMIYRKPANWEKFANSVKLRLYNHLSATQPNGVTDFLNTNPVLITANSDNAKVIFGITQANANPIYQMDVTSGRTDEAVCATLVDKMKALNDPRIPVYFNVVQNNGQGYQGQYRGNAPGGSQDDASKNLYSRVGTYYASISSPVILMSAAEVQYIIAEARVNSGDQTAAKQAYETAITNDFEMLGLSASTAGYLSNPDVAFDGTLKRVMEQKWVTMYQATYESWTDWRRTGFPELHPAVNNYTSNVIPVRIPYPQSEINLNAKSLQNGPGIPVPYKSLKVPVWWNTK